MVANDRFDVQIKFQSVKLARKYLERVSSELETIKGGPDEEELMLQGVRFAFRVHQVGMYGGFFECGDTEAELNVARFPKKLYPQYFVSKILKKNHGCR